MSEIFITWQFLRSVNLSIDKFVMKLILIMLENSKKFTISICKKCIYMQDNYINKIKRFKNLHQKF